MPASKHLSPNIRLLIATWPDDAPRGAIEAFCEEHSISRSVFHKIRARAHQGGLIAAVEPISTRPKTSPARTSDELVHLVVKMREQLQQDGLDHGPLSVIARLRRTGFTELPSRATVARIFSQAGLVEPEPRKKPRSAHRRFVYPAPNCLWQIDATEWTLANGSICVIFQVIDDHSRLALASLVARAETSDAAVRVVQLAVARHNPPQKFLSDNGVALNPSRRGYSSKLVDYLTALGVETITGKPYKPTTQGKNERFHRTLHRFLNARPAAQTLTELQALVDEFDLYYNTQREHQALTGRTTPQEAWNRTPPAPSPKPAPTAVEVIAAERALAAIPPGEATLKVTAGGRTYILGSSFRLGMAFLGRTIHAIWDNSTITFYEPNGAIIAIHPIPANGSNVGARHALAAESTKS
jgi:putative transposase